MSFETVAIKKSNTYLFYVRGAGIWRTRGRRVPASLALITTTAFAMFTILFIYCIYLFNFLFAFFGAAVVFTLIELTKV